MCRSARLHILGAEAEERSDEAHDAVLYAVRAPNFTVKFIKTESPCPPLCRRSQDGGGGIPNWVYTY